MKATLARTAALCCLAATASAADVRLFEAGWRDDFATIGEWTAQVSWLGNPCPQATVTGDDGAARFAVVGDRLGMKWRRPLPGVWIGEDRCLAFRYRAEGLLTASDDYFIFLDDSSRKGAYAVRLRDVKSDGQWRTAAVDLSGIAESDTLRHLAVQVQAAGAGGARVWLDALWFTDRAPRDCEEIGAEHLPPPAPPWWADLDAAAWEAQPTWLSNPGPAHTVTREQGATAFAVTTPGCGMKWSWHFPEQVTLAGHRYVALRYRATNTAPRGGYTVCVLADANPDGRSYTNAVAATELRHDGRWHTLTLPVDEAARLFPKIKGVAVQAQADLDGPGQLVIRKLGLVNEIEPTAAEDLGGFEPGADFTGFEALAPDGSGVVKLGVALQAMRATGWPGGERVTVGGAPFVLPQTDDLVWAAGLRARGDVAITVGKRCSQVFLYTLAMLRGKEEPVFSRDAKLSAVREIDRFRLRLEYEDGSQEECFPFNASLGAFEIVDGGQALCAFADHGKTLARVVVRDNMEQGAFVIVALTCRTRPDPLFEEWLEERPAVRPKVVRAPPGARPPRLRRRGGELALEGDVIAGRLALEPLPRFLALTNRLVDDNVFKRGAAEPLYQVDIDGKVVPAERFSLRECRLESDCTARLTYEDGDDPRLRLTVQLSAERPHEIVLEAVVENLGPAALSLGLAGPRLGRCVLGDRLRDNQYVYPQQGCLFHDRPVLLRQRYGGRFPVQFIAAVNPGAGSGLYLRTEDVEGALRDYLFEKSDAGLQAWLEYPPQSTPPGARLATVRTVVGLGSGDWHDAFRAYVDWVRTWHKPLSPRRQWFREIFNFRQRFLHSHGPLYDSQAGTFHLERALDEAEEHFGGLEYLHLFDWGRCGRHGRIYGRIGDYSPYDYLSGGQDAFRAAIAGVRRRGVPVGLYIEGYLLQENGRLGQAHGRQWQLRDRRGKGVYWPDSTEMMICPWVGAWREVQAATYAAKVAELDVDGMYLDQFGFANPGKDCWSTEHGHPTPGYAVLGERGLATLVRNRIGSVKKAVALYGEETPCDVNSQVQDGSFTYHMRSCRYSQPWAPLHLLRFAIPSFKTFEILVCDQPMGCWAEGVKWTFFNGEGIWLEGPAEEWFRPETRAAIRKCHAIMRAHRDAFTCSRPTPLVQTETGGVHANLFPLERKAVYTLYNARHRAVDGPVLAVAARPAARYIDAWHGGAISPERRGDRHVISLKIGPRDVGCLVVSW